MNAAGGQFTSLADAVTLVETLLNPIHPKSMLTPATLNKWLQPAHSFDEDNLTEMGLMWEIIKAYDSNNRLRKIYWKCKPRLILQKPIHLADTLFLQWG